MTGPMLPQGPPDPTQTPNAAQQVQNNQATNGPVPPQVSAPVPGAQDMGGPQAAPSTVTVPTHVAQKASRLASIGHFVTGMSNPNATPTQKMFQSIFRGALAGMGTAGENAASPGAGSPWAAIGRGAAAAQQQQQQQAQIQRQQTQQEFENQQKKEASQREKQLVDAQIANFQAEQIARQHTMDFEDKERLDKHNAANEAIYNSLKSAGGVPPPDGSLPATIDAYDLQQKYVDTKGAIRQPSDPKNWTRHFIDTTNSEEVDFDPYRKMWVGRNDGKPVDMSKNTEFKVLDVPREAMTEKVLTPNKDINAAWGSKALPPDGSSMAAPIDLINAKANHLKEVRESQSANIQDRQLKLAEDRANKDKFDVDSAGITKQIEELQSNPLNDPDGSKVADLKDQLKTTKSDYDTRYQEIWGKGAAPPKDDTSKKKPPPSADEAVNKAVAAVSSLNPDAARSAIESSTSLTPDQKQKTLEEWKKQQKQNAQTRREVLTGIIKNVATNPTIIP